MVESRPIMLHVMGWRSQQYGSFERFLVELARQARRHDIETHLVFQNLPASQAFITDVDATIHVLAGATTVGDPRHLLGLARLYGQLRPRWLHAHFGYDSYNALALARLWRIPFRFTTMHIVPHSPTWKLPRTRQRWLARQVDIYWAVSNYVARQLVKLGVAEDKLEVCHLGVDCDTYRPDSDLRARTRRLFGLDDHALLVLSASHLRPGKGTEHLPALCDRLRRRFPNVVVAVAGDGPMRAQIEAGAAALGCGEHLRMLGVREDLPALLAACDLFVFPTQTTEGMGLGVLEAMAAELPVVASNVSDLGEIPDTAIALVDRGDIDAFGQACEQLLADRSRARALARHARTIALERFSVKAAVAAHLRGYFRRDRARVSEIISS
jgi:glycosyltransferase involved in cell wall biosynthesis